MTNVGKKNMLTPVTVLIILFWVLSTLYQLPNFPEILTCLTMWIGSEQREVNLKCLLSCVV
jgi:hypothetical protein